MTGEILALCSAFFYGVAGVTISQSKLSARGDNGVFLSVVVTFVMTFVLSLILGGPSLSHLTTWNGAGSLALFAMAGFFSTVLGRVTMYRATERIGSVKAALFRRLIPVFAVPSGLLFLGEWPEQQVFVGGTIILLGVVSYQLLSSRGSRSGFTAGEVIGIASAIFYAVAYSLRRMGLEHIADPLFGTLVGALVGLVWFLIVAAVSDTPSSAFQRLICDHGRWHWATALSLGLGQILQFAALSKASVSVVAVLGALDLFFSAAIIALFCKGEHLNGRLLGLAGGLALLGSAVLFS
jgi:drug/metabolite transporter (DMT)-like permease